jgi:hypothetical protein
MDAYKKLGKTIEGLVLICNSTFPTINSKILETTDSAANFKDTIKIYSVYASSLNLLVSYSSGWNYVCKKLGLLIKTNKKSEKAKAYIENSNKKLSELFGNIVTQFRTISNTLEELSKRFDDTHVRRESDGEIRNFGDIAKFLSGEIDEIDKTKLPKLNAGILETKTGGNEKVISRRNKTQQTLSLASTSAMEGYKVIVGGEDDKKKYICGTEEMQIIKQKIIKLQNLKQDLQEDNVTESYYNDVFLPTLASILDEHEDDKVLTNLLQTACQSPQEYLQNMIIKNDPQKNLNEQLRYISQHSIPAIIKYCSDRGQIAPALPAGSSYQEIFRFLQTLTNLINEQDVNIIEKSINQEFENYEEIGKDLEPKLTELEENYQMLSDQDFEPLYRQSIKRRYTELFQNIEDMLEAPISDLYSIHRVYQIKPCVRLSDLQNLSIVERMSRICEIMEYIIDVMSAVLPNYQKIESYYNTLTNLLSKSVEIINDMIAPTNKKTCVRRVGLLASSIVRAFMLPILAEKRHVSIDNRICENIAVQLITRANLGELKTDKIYREKKGLHPELIFKLTHLLTL